MKLKYLLPIAAVASVGTIATSLVSCGSQSEDVILINKKIKFDGVGDTYSSETMSFNTEDTYRMQFKWSDASTIGCTDAEEGWSLFSAKFDQFNSNNPKINSIDRTSVKVYLDGIQLDSSKYSVDDVSISPNEAFGVNNSSIIRLEFKLSEIKATEGTFTVCCNI